MKIIPIEAGGTRHDVIVGRISGCADRFPNRPLSVVTDQRVWNDHHGALPFAADPIFVPEGEAAKSWGILARLVEELAGRNVTRDTPIIAFGGGSIGDVGGLASALFKRGCPLIHIPTTLVAQVDSAIGGKTAIDAAGVKNLVGTFYLPDLVICDPSFLQTLERRHLRAGYAELVKYGLIDSGAMFAWCEAHAGDMLDGDLAVIEEGIARAIRMKAAFIAEDFHDRLGRRALLNFGHTFGHAIESLAGLGAILHGEAVAVGMALAFGLSVELGFCSVIDAQRAISHLRSVGLPTRLGDLGIRGRGQELVELMSLDKKMDAGGMKLILTRGIGRAYLSSDVGAGQLADFLGRAA